MIHDDRGQASSSPPVIVEPADYNSFWGAKGPFKCYVTQMRVGSV